MYLLLDTHLYLWWLKEDKKLSKKAKEYIINAQKVYISSAAIWEIAIKIKIGKLTGTINDFLTAIETQGFVELPITAQHAAFTTNLANHHRDPFDRIMVAQALSEPLKFLTADQTLKHYSEIIELV